MKVGRPDGQTTNTASTWQRGRQRDGERQAETQREMDAYARLSCFPTRMGAGQVVLAVIGVKCDYDCDWNWRQRSGSRSSRKERCLARAYGATSSRPTTGPNALATERQLAGTGTWAASSRWHACSISSTRASRINNMRSLFVYVLRMAQ